MTGAHPRGRKYFTKDNSLRAENYPVKSPSSISVGLKFARNNSVGVLGGKNRIFGKSNGVKYLNCIPQTARIIGW